MPWVETAAVSHPLGLALQIEPQGHKLLYNRRKILGEPGVEKTQTESVQRNINSGLG